MTDDRRDERIAERLHVEPLDEVTRARLVRTALSATDAAAAAPGAADHPSTRYARTRVLTIAAVLVALLVVGLAVVLRDDSGSGPTAADVPNTVERRDRARSDDAGDLRLESSGFEEFSARSNLGDLGDVGSAAKLRRALAATAATPAAGAPNPSAQSAPTLATPSSEAAPCGSDAVDRLGKRVAAGVGTVDGEPVTVYVVERPNGSRVAVVVDADCVAREPVKL